MKSTIKGLKLSDIIAEIKKLDDMIVMHKKHTKDNLMSSQYEARKDKLFSELLYELASPRFRSQYSYTLAGQLINKFYKKNKVQVNPNDKNFSELRELASLLK
ncbi:MAG: hypothetical protein ABI723_11610 [Bacteroidia bacterium]